jgi:hypothetical protein
MNAIHRIPGRFTDYSCNLTTDDAFTAGLVSFMKNITALYASSPGPLKTRFFCAVGLMSPTQPLQAVLNAIADANAAGLQASFLDLRNGTKDGVSIRIDGVMWVPEV